MSAFERIDSKADNDPMAVQIFRLDNGLTVYLTENHEEPRFYAEIAVRAGSKHDPAETTGLAHYLEHLLFKGTPELGTLDYEKEKPHLDRIRELYEEHFREHDPEVRKAIYREINRVSQLAAEHAIPNEFDKLYKSMGATGVNAHTWHEETVYKVELPSNRIGQWAKIEGARFADPVFRIFHTELETVYEEKNRSLDNRARIISEAAGRQLFKKMNYGQQTTLGSVEHLKRPSIVKIQKFYDTYYVPNNMAIIVSGDIEIDETMTIIDAHFSIWRPRPLPEFTAPVEPPLQGAERVSVNYLGEEYVLLAFRTVPNGHVDEDALRIIDLLLDNSVAGLINLNLNQSQLLREAGSYPYLFNDAGAQYLWGIPKQDQSLEEVESLLLEQVDHIRQGEFDDWIIPAIVTDFKKQRKMDRESNRRRVSLIRDTFLRFEPWDHHLAQIDRLEALTKDQVVGKANRYFGSDFVAGYRRDAKQQIPHIEKPQIDKIKIEAGRQSEFAAGIVEMPVESLEPRYIENGRDYTKSELAPGVALYHTPNPLNDLFTITFSFDIGSYEEPRLPITTQLIDKAGTRHHKPDDLKKEWYRLGAEFSFTTGEWETRLRVNGMDENFAETVALIWDVLKSARADQGTLHKLVDIVIDQREDEKKDHRTLSRALTLYSRFDTDSRFNRRLPAEALRALKAEDLLALFDNLTSFEHTVAYAGSIPLDEVGAELASHYDRSAPRHPPPAYTHRRARKIEDHQIYFYDKDIAQSQIRIEFPNGIYQEAKTPIIELYNSYFAGGMSGIVFQELREARGLAYSAGARYFNGARQGDENLVVGSIACQADKTVEALSAFLHLFDQMPRSEDRFGNARASIDNRYRSTRINFREIAGQARGWERKGLSGDPGKARFERNRETGIEELFAFHSASLVDRPKLISIVGNKEKIAMEQLARLGTLIYVPLESMFAD